MRSLILSTLMGVVLAFSGGAAKAELIQVDVYGVMREGNVWNVPGVIFNAGDRIKGSFVYDVNYLETLDPCCYPENNSLYISMDSPRSSNVFVSSTFQNLSRNDGLLSFHNLYSTNNSLIQLGGDASTYFGDLTYQYEQIGDKYNYYLLDFGFSTSGPVLENIRQVGTYFTSGWMGMEQQVDTYDHPFPFGQTDKFQFAYADLTQITVSMLSPTEVPEPASALLLGMGVLGVAALGRRTSKNNSGG